MPKLPERINRLDELANNLWWSWNDRARQLFRKLDYPLWRLTVHNPVSLLLQVSPDTLEEAAANPAFVNQYNSVMADFDLYMGDSSFWFNTNYSDLLSGPVAFFSMESAIHKSLPIYAGGLGVLAGDIYKEASDLGLPMVAVGFMYPQGYFHQHISADGLQEEVYRQVDFSKTPINRVVPPGEGTGLVQVEIGSISISIAVWQVRVGRTILYLLDTNLDENPSVFHNLSSRLYIADREQRIRQEIVLGIGGVRALRALKIYPRVWHANEGHTSFMMLERLREEVNNGASLAEATGRIQSTTVFTTHTPVLAGHDIFPYELVEQNMRHYWESLGIGRDEFLKLGRQGESGTGAFNMTALGLRLANQRCAVSQLHEQVTRHMWHGLWPDLPESEVPITHITNGIHVSSWIAPELYYLFVKYMGKNWMHEHDTTVIWEKLRDIPDEEFWSVHQLLKRKLFAALREGGRERWADQTVTPDQVMAMGVMLSPEILTIGFARRFTEYKRPLLIFHDVERLKRIINNQLRPVQVIFAGKSHPADFPSKRLLQRMYSLATQRDLKARIAFAEDYDIHIARYLVQGVDVWLNTPRRHQEASGTSGMKASLNGVINLSVRDGWWHEGYNGENGWAIGTDMPSASAEDDDQADAAALYRLLEEEIVPLYYDRANGDIPHRWISMAKEAIRSVAPVFSTRRMLKEYIERMYRPAAQWRNGI